jgi:hypothetical protein
LQHSLCKDRKYGDVTWSNNPKGLDLEIATTAGTLEMIGGPDHLHGGGPLLDTTGIDGIGAEIGIEAMVGSRLGIDMMVVETRGK